MTERLAVISTLRALVAEISVADLPTLVGDIEGVKAAAWARLTAPTAQAPANPRLVDAAEMADLLGTPENWVRDKARAGVLPYVRLGHYMKFNPTDVLEVTRHLPAQHNGALRAIKKRKQTQDVTSQVYKECPTSSATEGAKPA